MYAFIGYILLIGIVFVIAVNSGRRWWVWMLMSLILTPIVTLIILGFVTWLEEDY
jgi:hypothetical protein